MISRTLMNAIRHEGFSKVAAEVQKKDGEMTQNLDSLHGIAKAASTRFLVDEANLQEMLEGVEALRRMEEYK